MADCAERAHGIKAKLFVPGRNAPIECGHVDEEVVVDELVEREPAGLCDEQRCETDAPHLVVEQLRYRLLLVCQRR